LRPGRHSGRALEGRRRGLSADARRPWLIFGSALSHTQGLGRCRGRTVVLGSERTTKKTRSASVLLSLHADRAAGELECVGLPRSRCWKPPESPRMTLRPARASQGFFPATWRRSTGKAL